mmetsp:Transcript_6898/g.16566  ORF Transcript_6898/g.16566 Transcript_6898/m.16566 type:complete len:203 (-) Transcript_6898:351-959(-)
MLVRVSAAATSFSLTSVALAFVSASTEMSSSSSRRLPELADRRSRSSSSSRRSDLVLLVTSSSTFLSCSSRERCSFWITMPSSCSSRPFWVTVKSTTVVLAWSSGEKCGFGSRVVRYMLKSSLNSQSLSDRLIYFDLALVMTCFSSTGVSIGSSSCSTPEIMSAQPSLMQNSTWSRSRGLLCEVTPKVGIRSASWFLIQFSA